MREAFLSVMIGAAFVILGCGGGLTSAEKESLIATAVARTDAQAQRSLREAFQEQNDEMTKKILVQNEHLQGVSDKLYDRFNAEIDQFQKFFDERAVALAESSDKEYDKTMADIRSLYNQSIEEIRLSNAQVVEDVRKLNQQASNDAERRNSEVSADIASLLDKDTLIIQSFLNSICETDYWLTALWNVALQLVSHLEGGEGSIESARAYFGGLTLNANYAESSGVCGVDDDNKWYLLNDGL